MLKHFSFADWLVYGLLKLCFLGIIVFSVLHLDSLPSDITLFGNMFGKTGITTETNIFSAIRLPVMGMIALWIIALMHLWSAAQLLRINEFEYNQYLDMLGHFWKGALFISSANILLISLTVFSQFIEASIFGVHRLEYASYATVLVGLLLMILSYRAIRIEHVGTYSIIFPQLPNSQRAIIAGLCLLFLALTFLPFLS